LCQNRLFRNFFPAKTFFKIETSVPRINDPYFPDPAADTTRPQDHAARAKDVKPLVHEAVLASRKWTENHLSRLSRLFHSVIGCRQSTTGLPDGIFSDPKSQFG
jgi:hypothetical protein